MTTNDKLRVFTYLKSEGILILTIFVVNIP
jgi:hypothetical protein